MRFSSVELFDLGKAWIALSLAFAILYASHQLFTPAFWQLFLISAIVVGTGFLLHELAHKFFAQRSGCWAEFRADNKMLLFMLGISFFGFIFAAPGAVHIQGSLTRQKHGKISLAGPGVNLLLALLCVLFLFAGVDTLLIRYGLSINSWLAVFNLLPFPLFDGQKVLLWHKGVYFIALLSSVALVAASWLLF